MYKRVLVPLDHSELAECTLNHVKNMAKDGAIGEVILLNAVVIEHPLQEISWEETEVGHYFNFDAFRNKFLEKSKKYLASIQTRLVADGIATIKTESIEVGRPAQVIVDYAHQNSIDLIVMSTHGYTGFKKMLLGSVALQVLQESTVPVLLIRPESCRP